MLELKSEPKAGPKPCSSDYPTLPSLTRVASCTPLILSLAPVSQASRTTLERPEQLIRVCFQPRTSPNRSACWVLAALCSMLPTVPEGAQNSGRVETSPKVVCRGGISLSLPVLKPSGGSGLQSGPGSFGLDDLFIRWLGFLHSSTGICCRGKWRDTRKLMGLQSPSTPHPEVNNDSSPGPPPTPSWVLDCQRDSIWAAGDS